MKRQLTSMMLFSALLVGGASSFVSCTDHESDSAYNTSVSLADAIAEQKAKLQLANEELAKKLDKTTYATDKAAIEARIAANDSILQHLDENYVTYAKLNAATEACKAYTDTLAFSVFAATELLRTQDSTAFALMDSVLQDQIDTLASKVSSLEDLTDKMNHSIDDLVNKNLSSIAINATENPVTGYWNAAFLGSQVNLASSFYGVAAQSSKTFGIEAGQLLNNKNAGCIYVSLNPTEFNPDLITELELVNSQGEPAKGFETSGDITPSDKVLTYGYTRATSENGFYEVPIIATDPQNDDLSLDKGALKEAATEIINKLQNPKTYNMDLSKVASTLYKNLNNNKLQAYTLKATYYLYNSSTGKFEEKHQVAPTYNVAAFAVKPLSYNFLKDNSKLGKLSNWAMEKFQLPSMSSAFDKIIDALDIEISVSDPTVNVYTIVAATDVTVKKVGDKVVFYKSDNTELYSFTDAKAEVEECGDPITIGSGTDSHQQHIYKITTSNDAISKVVEEINETIGTKLYDAKEDVHNAQSKWESMITPVNSLLQKVSKNIANANALLQPTMLYKSSKTGNWNTLSTLKGKLGTRMTGTGSTVLVATSWNAELLAPAYMKSVTVEGTGAKVTLMDGSSAEKFSGDIQKVLFTADKAGTYTIKYKAVDYSGVEVEKDYTIVVE